MSFPVRVENYELLPDSGRGGAVAGWTRRPPDVADPRARLARDGAASAPSRPRSESRAGRRGAGPHLVVDPDGAERILNSKARSTPGRLARRLRRAGLGGFGPAAERDDARIREDLADGYVTPDGARRDYGVTDLEALLRGDDAKASRDPG